MKVQTESRKGNIYMTLIPESDTDNTLISMASDMNVRFLESSRVMTPWIDGWKGREHKLTLIFKPRQQKEGE